MCMVKNGKDAKHTRHISRRLQCMRNFEKSKMHKIYWCEGGLQLVYIVTKNDGENDLNPRMRYILVRLDN